MTSKLTKKRKRESKSIMTVDEYSSASVNSIKTSKKKKVTDRYFATSGKSDGLTSNANRTSPKKKMQTPTTLIKQMMPSTKELDFRKKKIKSVKSKDLSFMFVCTKCGYDLSSVIKQQKIVNCHPLLDVLMCFECSEYYGDGDFSLDSDDEDKYCRWCGEGGTIYSCSQCICGFCHKCIESHFGKLAVKNVQKEDNWLCYFCNPEPLWDLRFICSLAKLESEKKEDQNQKLKSNMDDKTKNKRNNSEKINALRTESDDSSRLSFEEKNNKNKTKGEEEDKKEKRRRYHKCCDSSTEDSSDDSFDVALKLFKRRKLINNSKIEKNIESYKTQTSSSEKEEEENENRAGKEKKIESESIIKNFEKQNSLRLLDIFKKLENGLKLTKYHMGFGMKWSTKKLKDLSNKNLFGTAENLRKECRKIKWFLSFMASSLVSFGNSVELLEKELTSNNENESEVEEKEIPPTSHPTSSYAIILNFLAFIKNQAVTFSQKGIEFEDLIASEIYENENVLGLLKKNWRILDEKHQPQKVDDEISKPLAEIHNNEDSNRENEKPESSKTDDEIPNSLTKIHNNEDSSHEKEKPESTKIDDETLSPSNVLHNDPGSDDENGKNSTNFIPFQDDEIDNIVTILKEK